MEEENSNHVKMVRHGKWKTIISFDRIKKSVTNEWAELGRELVDLYALNPSSSCWSSNGKKKKKRFVYNS